MRRVCGQDSQRARKEKGESGGICVQTPRLSLSPARLPTAKCSTPWAVWKCPLRLRAHGLVGSWSHRRSDQPHLWKFQIPRGTAHQCFISAGTVLSQVPRCQARIASGLQLPAQTPHQRATSPADTPCRERPAGGQELGQERTRTTLRPQLPLPPQGGDQGRKRDSSRSRAQQGGSPLASSPRRPCWRTCEERASRPAPPLFCVLGAVSWCVSFCNQARVTRIRC